MRWNRAPRGLLSNAIPLTNGDSGPVAHPYVRFSVPLDSMDVSFFAGFAKR